MAYTDIYVPRDIYAARERHGERLFRYDAERAIIEIRRHGVTYVVDLATCQVGLAPSPERATTLAPAGDGCTGR